MTEKAGLGEDREDASLLRGLSTTKSTAPVTSASARKSSRPGIGMPAAIYLDEFGSYVGAAFEPAGFGVYHVGSSLTGKRWRDVDVRLILSDEEYEQLGLGDPRQTHSNRKWVAFTLAFSALGRQMTGLPIDFQIQQQTLCNEQFKGGRSALGVHACFRHLKSGGA